MRLSESDLVHTGRTSALSLTLGRSACGEDYRFVKSFPVCVIYTMNYM